MKEKLLDISNKIDPFTLDVLTLVSKAADSLDLDFFVIGASARDILFKLVYNINIYRGTNDIDFSVRVRNWNDYNKLKDKLLLDDFSASNIIHKFSYKSIPGIDIIPFGKISINSASITWPDYQTKEMSVLGFEECFSDSESVIVNNKPNIFVKVASVRGLVIMKLISWQDGYPSRATFNKLYLKPLVNNNLIKLTIPESPNSPKQEYVITDFGRHLLGGYKLS